MSCMHVMEVVSEQGLVVRQTRNLKSKAAAERLAKGSRIKVLEEAGERLRFQKLSGDGPDEGWVSMVANNRALLKPFADQASVESKETTDASKVAEEGAANAKDAVAAKDKLKAEPRAAQNVREEQADFKAAEDATQRADEEPAVQKPTKVVKKNAEEEAATQTAAGEAKKKADKEAAAQTAAEAAEKKAEDKAAAQKLAEQAKLKLEEAAAAQTAAEEAKKKKDEEAAAQDAAEEAKKKADEKAQNAAEEAKRLAEEDAATRNAEDEATRKVAEDSADLDATMNAALNAKKGITLYYHTAWDRCFLHHCLRGEQVWGDVALTEATDVALGWKQISLDADGVEFVLCDAGRAHWDNPPHWYGHQNYLIEDRGTYVLRDGHLKPFSDADTPLGGA